MEEIADELHVNRSYLSRFYKNKTGVNLFDEILKLRIESAKEYLLKTVEDDVKHETAKLAKKWRPGRKRKQTEKQRTMW